MPDMGVRASGSARTTVTVVAELGSLADEWDSLVDVMPVPSPFLRSWWLEAVAGEQPVFVLAHRDEHFLGGLALEREDSFGLPLYRVMGHGALGPDHIDLVADPARRTEAVEAIGGWMRRPGSRFFDLDGILEHSQVARALPGPVAAEPFAVAPWEPLPSDFDSYLKQRPAQLSRLLAKKARHMEAFGGSCRRVPDAEVDRAIETLRRLHEKQWGERSGFMPVFGLFARAAPQGVRRGELLFYEAAVQGTVIAIQVWFNVAGRVSFYQSGRNLDASRLGGGALLTAAVIGDACRRKCREVDFLRGDEQYKALWTTHRRQLMRLQCRQGAAARTISTVGRSLDSTSTGRRIKRTAQRLRP